MSMTESELRARLSYRVSGKPYLYRGSERQWEKMPRYDVLNSAINKLADYEDIGTVSEFRELKEKATAKEPRFYAHNYYCTECGNLVGNNEFKWQRFEYCDKCGQKIDWSEGKE